MVLTDAPLSILEETIGAVLDDANVDCATIVLAAGIERWASAIVNMFDRLRQHVSKPITIWIYGTKVSVREEVARHLEAMGFPTYLELEAAIKALGIAADYAKFKSQLEHQASE